MLTPIIATVAFGLSTPIEPPPKPALVEKAVVAQEIQRNIEVMSQELKASLKQNVLRLNKQSMIASISIKKDEKKTELAE